MRKLAQLIKILVRRKVSDDDLVNLWLILFFWTNIEEQTPVYVTCHTDNGKVNETFNSSQFHRDHQVKPWQDKLWHIIAKYKVRRVDSHWGWDKLFLFGRRTIIPVPYRYRMSKHIFQRSWPYISLQCSPMVKRKEE